MITNIEMNWTSIICLIVIHKIYMVPDPEMLKDRCDPGFVTGAEDAVNSPVACNLL